MRKHKTAPHERSNYYLSPTNPDQVLTLKLSVLRLLQTLKRNRILYWDQVTMILMSIHNSNQRKAIVLFDYFTHTKRFEYGSYLDSSKMYDKMPGPGNYYQDSSKKNKSFNLMFN